MAPSSVPATTPKPKPAATRLSVATTWRRSSPLLASSTMVAKILRAQPAAPSTRDGVTSIRYRDPGGRDIIESWLVSGMPHAWSGGDPRGTHTYPAGPDATDVMLDFLLPDPR